MNTDGGNLVEVPDTSSPLDDDKLQLLQQWIDVTADDRNYGIHTLHTHCRSNKFTPFMITCHFLNLVNHL